MWKGGSFFKEYLLQFSFSVHWPFWHFCEHIMTLFMLMNFFAKCRILEILYVSWTKKSLLWHTLWFPKEMGRKRLRARALQSHRNICIYTTRDADNALRIQCVESNARMKRNECVTNHVIYRLYETSKADEKMTRLWRSTARRNFIGTRTLYFSLVGKISVSEISLYEVCRKFIQQSSIYNETCKFSLFLSLNNLLQIYIILS